MPEPARGWTFEFETNAGIVTHVSVIVPLPQREHWPSVDRNPASGIAAGFRAPTPHLPFIQRELRTLQGVLSLCGLSSIDVKHPEVEWLPESEEERLQLPFFQHRVTEERLPDEAVPPFPFDFITRAVIAADAATDIATPLNFFRRGMLDLNERNYIEAIYDFYFILETVFGEGKFKSAAVSSAFLSSDQLRSCVKRAIEDPGPMIALDARTRAAFERSYGKMSVEDVVNRLIELRGYLHHHTSKRRNMWNPEEQHRYELHALFFQVVTYNVMMAIAEPYLYRADVVQAYEDLVRRSKGGGAVS